MLKLQAVRDRRQALPGADPWRRRLKAAKPVVLVVDDDPAVHDTLRFILRAKCNVESAMSAEEGLEKMNAVPGIELVFMDITLPGMDGIAAMAVIKERWPAVPVTIVSEIPDPELMPRMIELGAFHCMRKDFDFEWMNELLQTALESSRAFRENEDLINSIYDLTRERDSLAAKVAELEGNARDAVKAG